MIPHTPAHRLAIAKARTGTHHTPLTRNKISLKMLGHVVSPDTRALMQARALYRKNQLKALLAHYASYPHTKALSYDSRRLYVRCDVCNASIGKKFKAPIRALPDGKAKVF